MRLCVGVRLGRGLRVVPPVVLVAIEASRPTSNAEETRPDGGGLITGWPCAEFIASVRLSDVQMTDGQAKRAQMLGNTRGEGERRLFLHHHFAARDAPLSMAYRQRVGS